MNLYHGSIQPFSAHVGLCLTDDDVAAEEYISRWGGFLTKVFLNADDLLIMDLDAAEYPDHAPGDAGTAADYPADVISYADGNEFREHHTWRVASEAAVAALSVVWTERV